MEDSLNLGGQTLHRWNLRLMPNISYAGCPGLLEWFRRNSVLKCVLQPKIAKNSLKPPILGVQGSSWSSMLVPLESSSAVLVTLSMISSKSVSICNRFYARWANSGKITISKGVLLFDALVGGESPHPVAPKLPHKKLDSSPSHGEDPCSLYLTWPWIRTGSWQMDRQNSHS